MKNLNKWIKGFKKSIPPEPRGPPGFMPVMQDRMIKNLKVNPAKADK